jgi:hypothetical protein
MLILTAENGTVHFYGFDGYWAGYLPTIYGSAHPPNVDGTFIFSGFGINFDEQFIAVDSGTTYSIDEYTIIEPNISGTNYSASLSIIAPTSCPGGRTFWRMTFDLLDSSVFQISIDYDY